MPIEGPKKRRVSGVFAKSNEVARSNFFLICVRDYGAGDHYNAAALCIFEDGSAVLLAYK